MSIELISALHTMRAVLRTGACGQREVWERQLEAAAAALAAKEAELAAMREALRQINEIELQEYGPDYAEIEQAQIIASAALSAGQGEP